MRAFVCVELLLGFLFRILTAVICGAFQERQRRYAELKPYDKITLSMVSHRTGTASLPPPLASLPFTMTVLRCGAVIIKWHYRDGVTLVMLSKMLSWASWDYCSRVIQGSYGWIVVSEAL